MGLQHFFDKSEAERKGFEPSMQFPAYTLSRRAPSTTRTPLFIFCLKSQTKYHLFAGLQKYSFSFLAAE